MTINTNPVACASSSQQTHLPYGVAEVLVGNLADSEYQEDVQSAAALLKSFSKDMRTALGASSGQLTPEVLQFRYETAPFGKIDGEIVSRLTRLPENLTISGTLNLDRSTQTPPGELNHIPVGLTVGGNLNIIG